MHTDSSILSWELGHIVAILLSDNLGLIDWYKKLNLITNYESVFISKNIQYCLNGEFNKIILNIPGQKNVDQESSIDFHDHCFEFFKGIQSNDSFHTEIYLKKLFSPESNLSRGSEELWTSIYPTPEIGFLKLTKFLNLKLEMNSNIYPAEFLEVNPIPEYRINYDFLFD